MKPTVKYGLLLGAGLAALPLLVYALGLDKETWMRWPSSMLNIAIIAACISYGILEVRKTAGNGFITFGKAFSTGSVIVLISSLISGISSWLYFSVINPGMVTFIRTQQEEAMAKRGMSDADIEKFAPKMAVWTTPEMMSLFGFLGVLLLGIVITLIVAAILKKEDPNAVIS